MSRCATNLPWGYQDVPQSYNQVPSPEEQLLQHQLQQQQQQQQQYANLPAALLGTLKREKKPFTYTPGGVNLSEVLEARLQKRMERKKKYMEEAEQEQQDRRPMLVVAPTYNTPLNMYSMENALETLEVQAQMAASRSPSSSTLPRNYRFKFQEDEDIEPPQSKAFRVLQVMTDTDSYSGGKKQKDGPMSEMRWTGLKEGRPSNPSRFFHTLQKITGTDAEEEQERQENSQFEKRIAPTQTAPTYAPPMQVAPAPVAPMHAAPARAPAPLQHQPSFGSIPKLKRPAAFLPKQQPWSYTRMPAVTPVGTDF